MRGGEISTGAILRVEMRLAELGGAIFLKNARRDVNSRCSFSRFSAINLAASRGRETAKYPAIKSLDAASQRPPETAPLPDKVINNRVFFSLNELERYQDGNEGGNINFKPRITRVPFSIVFHFPCTRDNTIPLCLSSRFYNLESELFRKYLAKVNAVVFYVIGSALYIDYDLRSGFFGAVRTDSVPNLVNQIFTREKVRLGRVTDLNACKRILIFL